MSDLYFYVFLCVSVCFYEFLCVFICFLCVFRCFLCVFYLFFLQKNYRGPIDLTDHGLKAAESASSRLKIFYDKLSKVLANAGETSSKDIDLKTLSKSEAEFYDSF